MRRMCGLRTNTFQSFKHFHTLDDKNLFLNSVSAIELGGYKQPCLRSSLRILHKVRPVLENKEFPNPCPVWHQCMTCQHSVSCLKSLGLKLEFIVFFCYCCFQNQNFSGQPQLSWNFLRPIWPRTRDMPACLPLPGLKACTTISHFKKKKGTTI